MNHHERAMRLYDEHFRNTDEATIALLEGAFGEVAAEEREACALFLIDAGYEADMAHATISRDCCWNMARAIREREQS